MQAGRTKSPGATRGSLTVALGVSNPARAAAVRYRFRMEGLENEWQDTDEHQIRYSALPPRTLPAGHHGRRPRVATRSRHRSISISA